MKFNFTLESAAKNFRCPTLRAVSFSGEDATMTFHSRKFAKYDQSWLVGFTILELSKLHMYKSWYDTIMPTFGEDNVDMLFSDTDSLCFQIRHIGDADTALEMLAPIMDFSNLPPSHRLFDDSRKNALGYFKSEISDVPKAFAGVKAKR